MTLARRRSRGTAVAACALLGAVAVASAAAVLTGGAAEGLETDKEVLLTFDGATLPEQSGVLDVTSRLVTARQGEAVAAPGQGSGSAVRLPAHTPGAGPQAGFSVVDASGEDDLSPGTRWFRFGADFVVDAGALSTSSNAEDNGNNLIQRGLYDGQAQFKLQVDTAHPSCRIKGALGTHTLTSQATVQPGTWYRAWCQRDGLRMTLAVTRLSDGVTWTRTALHATGEVVMPPATPLTVGLKMSAPTTVAPPSADQFNGVVDNAFLDVRTG